MIPGVDRGENISMVPVLVPLEIVPPHNCLKLIVMAQVLRTPMVVIAIEAIGVTLSTEIPPFSLAPSH
jgi:hypothetical protein